MKGPGAPNKDEVDSSNLNEPTDVEVGKWTFHECLIHYMDGGKISHSNQKVVEMVLLVDAGDDRMFVV